MRLYRGVRNDVEMNNILTNGSAGGRPVNAAAAKPTVDQTKAQKGTSGECYPLTKGQVITIPEFVEYTTDINIAKQFGVHRGGVVQIEIEDRYVLVLAHDPLESGCFIRSEAPVVRAARI